MIGFCKCSRWSLIKKDGRLGTSKGWVILVLAVFLSVTGLDFVVNSILYSYGLDFSYVWYVPYQIGLSVTVFSVCVLVAWQSYEDTASMDVAFKRGLTLFLAHLGGLIDWIFFLVYNGGRVYSGEWTWMWQYSLLGSWNWKLQGIWSLSFLVLILGVWKANRMMFFDRVYDFLRFRRAKDRNDGFV
jgi:hypothetical protein